MRMSKPEGRSDALLSLSLGEDIWHILTVDMSLPRLLLLEVLIEFTFIFIGSVALTSVAAAEGQDLDSDLLSSKLMLSLTTVRISSDAIFGWAERTPSTKPEIAVLALLGWFHWLLLSVAGAIIVARALRPLQQVAFAPDCAVNEKEVAVRMTASPSNGGDIRRASQDDGNYTWSETQPPNGQGSDFLRPHYRHTDDFQARHHRRELTAV